MRLLMAASTQKLPQATGRPTLFLFDLGRPKPAGPTATSVAGLRDGRLRPARPLGSQKHSTHSSPKALVLGLAPITPRRSAPERRGRRPKGSQKLSPFITPILRSSSSTNNSSSPPAEAQRAPRSCSPPRGVAANCAAQRAAKARPTAQPNSPPQFSAPCPPHCGSAFAPPHFRAPARFIYIRLPPK